MANNQDARPFVDLKKDAEEFRVKFDEDIRECLSFLDSKITDLICDPDSFESPGRRVHQNSLAEFSKAKYDIFFSVRSLITTKEREWLDYIAEMKKLFVDNVEIFLAETKLEVKLPSSESMSSQGLGSSFLVKKSPSAASKAHVGVKTQFNRSSRSSASSAELANFSYEEEMDIEEQLDRSRSRSSSGNRPRKLSNSGLNTSRSSSGRRSSLKREMNSVKNEIISDVFSQTVTSITAPVRGRRGRLTEVNYRIENDSVGLDLKKDSRKQQTVKSRKGVLQSSSNSSDDNADQTNETSEKELPVRGRRGRSAPKAKTNDLTVAKNSSCSTNESEDQLAETMQKGVPVKERKGRSAPKTKTNVVQNSISSTDENESETIQTKVILKGRKGRSATKAKTNVIAQNSNTSDDKEGQTIEAVENEVPFKGRKGRSAPKAKTNVVAQNSNSADDDEDQTIENEVPLKGRKGRSAAKAKTNGQNVPQKKSIRGRKAVEETIEDIHAPGPSKSPKRVSFGGDQSSSDELDIQTPLARPVKSAARRKTLLPKLDDLSGTDIIPGITSRSKVKRKTISDVTELEAVASSKRLKVSQKTISSQEKDDSADDNLLESDDNYSEWMSLKSVDGKIPTRPAIYEVKVWRAKKPAYIGSCENLRQKLTLYNLRQNSGHKHLDKFIDRNYHEIQVRFEVVSSFNDAKEDVKNRIQSFKAKHKNPPAYN